MFVCTYLWERVGKSVCGSLQYNSTNLIPGWLAIFVLEAFRCLHLKVDLPVVDGIGHISFSMSIIFLVAVHVLRFEPMTQNYTRVFFTLKMRKNELILGALPS